MSAVSEIALWVEVPSVARAREARNFEELWRTLTNDELFGWGTLWGALAGGQRSLTHWSDLRPTDWPSFRETVSAVPQALGLVNLALAIPENEGEDVEEFIFRRAGELKDWAEINARTSRSPEVHRIVEEVVHALLLAADTDRAFRERRKRRTFEYLYALRSHEPEQTDDSVPSYDVFISYSHREHAGAARLLFEALSARGLACWFDRDARPDLLTDRAPRSELERVLKRAARSSRFTVLFPPRWRYAEATPPGEPESPYFRWQPFEQEHSHGVVRVTPAATAAELAETADRIALLVNLSRSTETSGRTRLVPQPEADEPLESSLGQAKRAGKRVRRDGRQDLTPCRGLLARTRREGSPVAAPRDTAWRYHVAALDRH
jgi:hypothetical protein